jgi:hypothetical protein
MLMKFAFTGTHGLPEVLEPEAVGSIRAVHGAALKRAYFRALRPALLFLAVGSAFGQTPAAGPVITGVSNNASGAAAIESGSWVSIYGTGLSATTRTWQASDFSGNTLPTTLDNVSVQIDGKKAAIAYISPGMLNVQAPADATIGTVPVVVTNASGSATGSANLQSYAPAFFTANGKYAAALHNSDGLYIAPAKRFNSTPLAWVPRRPP